MTYNIAIQKRDRKKFDKYQGISVILSVGRMYSKFINKTKRGKYKRQNRWWEYMDQKIELHLDV